MLRHIISVSLAMTACATLIPTKVNAATLTVTPVGTLQKNPGDSITFLLSLNPIASNPLPPDTPNRNLINFQTFIYEYDGNELSFSGASGLLPPNTLISNTRTIVELTFNVLQPVRDGNSDLFNAKAYYNDSTGVFRETSIAPNVVDVVPVPEPLTIFGTVTGLGCGALFKRKFSKQKES
jgi:hypothetical protein